ncbi:MAG: hypothetical protein H7841_05360, partial [Magnetospirillum sp. WYHS-4]
MAVFFLGIVDAGGTEGPGVVAALLRRAFHGVGGATPFPFVLQHAHRNPFRFRVADQGLAGAVRQVVAEQAAEVGIGQIGRPFLQALDRRPRARQGRRAFHANLAGRPPRMIPRIGIAGQGVHRLGDVNVVLAG